MARKSANSTQSAPAPTVRSAGRSFLHAVAMVTRVAAGLALVVGLVWGYTSAERYLSRGERFTLQPPGEDGETRNFELYGVRYGSEHRILNVFAQDFGRSVFLTPIAERRLSLLGIDWVADATVQRIWPDRLTVHIRERVPVAYVQVPGVDGTELAMLIDAQGVLLDPQRADVRLPVLAGIGRTEDAGSRKEKVKRFLQLQKELGDHMRDISEIDLSDVDNTKVVRSFDGRALTLALGGGSYGQRYQKFIDNVDHIRERLPNVISLDMRQKGRIVGVADATAIAQPVEVKQ